MKTPRQLVLNRYKTAKCKRLFANGWFYIFYKGNPWSIGFGRTGRDAWVDAARALSNKK